jgi:hypothetical protein
MSPKRLYEVGSNFHNDVRDGRGSVACVRQYIRGPRALAEEPKKGARKYLAPMKDDLKGMGSEANVTAEQIVSRAVKAIIGAVHQDGGFGNARKMQAHLGIIIRL